VSFDWAAAAGLGIGLGIVTGMPLGVINVAIVEAAVSGRVRFATAVGVGGALADTVHATLAFIGLGRLLIAQPGPARVLALVAAAIVIGYAVVTWRRRDVPAPPREIKAGRGVLVGLLLTLPNPAALTAWVAVAAAVWPGIAIEDGVVLGAGVGVGSGLWFAGLARIVSRNKEHWLVKRAAKIAVIALAAIALLGVVRAVTQ
jgi:threonine/homoserine/homoserine lactone efflux protein